MTASEAAVTPAACTRLAVLAGDAAADAPSVSLYVHVPFCSAKCAYCDFYSSPLAAWPPCEARWTVGADGAYADPVDEYLAAIDALAVAEPLLRAVPTLYVGGGTPSVLRDRAVELLDRIREHATLAADAEVTFEANPESTDLLLATSLAAAGVTRISLGVQSFDDAVLTVLGRRHDAQRAGAAADDIRKAGPALSIDLMCGVPGQTERSWRETLDRAVATGAVHASVYPLSVEEGTPLAQRIARGEISPPDPDLGAEMMLMAEDVLGDAGLARYEVANYARFGHHSRHNLRYWTGGEYLGVGPGAHSMLAPQRLALLGELGARTLEDLGVAPEAPGRVRFLAHRDLRSFAESGFDSAVEQSEYLTPGEACREDVMLGLRLVSGIPGTQPCAAGPAVRRALETLAERGLVERFEAGGEVRWRTTQRGWLLGNEVFAEVWTVDTAS